MQPDERRQHPRRVLDEDVLAYLDGDRLDAHTGNISEGGLYLRCSRPEEFPLGASVALVFHDPVPPGGEVFLVARVVRHQPGVDGGVGMQWDRAVVAGSADPLRRVVRRLFGINDPVLEVRMLPDRGGRQHTFRFTRRDEWPAGRKVVETPRAAPPPDVVRPQRPVAPPPQAPRPPARPFVTPPPQPAVPAGPCAPVAMPAVAIPAAPVPAVRSPAPPPAVVATKPSPPAARGEPPEPPRVEEAPVAAAMILEVDTSARPRRAEPARPTPAEHAKPPLPPGEPSPAQTESPAEPSSRPQTASRKRSSRRGPGPISTRVLARDSRQALDLPASLELAGVTIPGRLKWMGPGLAGVESPWVPAEPGAEMILRFQIPARGDPATVQGTVRACAVNRGADGSFACIELSLGTMDEGQNRGIMTRYLRWLAQKQASGEGNGN